MAVADAMLDTGRGRPRRLLFCTLFSEHFFHVWEAATGVAEENVILQIELFCATSAERGQRVKEEEDVVSLV